ncbi:hypothetical protein ACFLW8_05025 [Chloroflexota bacterium]
MSKKSKIITVALVATGLLVLSFAGIVQAHGPNDTNDEEQHGWGGCFGQGAIVSEAVSELLGLTHEEIETMRHEGKSLVAIAAAQGIDEHTLVEFMMATKRDILQQRVADGTLTAERVETMLQQMEQRTRQAVNRTETGPFGAHGGGQHGFAGGMGHGGMMNRGW